MSSKPPVDCSWFAISRSPQPEERRQENMFIQKCGDIYQQLRSRALNVCIYLRLLQQWDCKMKETPDQSTRIRSGVKITSGVAGHNPTFQPNICKVCRIHSALKSHSDSGARCILGYCTRVSSCIKQFLRGYFALQKRTHLTEIQILLMAPPKGPLTREQRKR